MADTIKDPGTGTELIWITDAMYRYRKSRDWFQRRIDNGKIKTMPQVGSIRVYMVVADVERELAKNDG